MRKFFSWKLWRQLLGEFWFPLTCALLWTGMVLWQDGFTWRAMIAAFGPAFFFCAWITSQFFRVSKQQAVTDNLNTLIEKLELQTRELIGHATGGETFSMLTHGAVIATRTFELLVHNPGPYPAMDINVTLIDLNERLANLGTWTRHSNAKPRLEATRYWGPVFQLSAANQARLRFNVDLVQRNGFAVYEYVVLWEGESPLTACRHSRVKGEGANWVYEVPEGFPAFDPNDPAELFALNPKPKPLEAG